MGKNSPGGHKGLGGENGTTMLNDAAAFLRVRLPIVQIDHHIRLAK
jgi:hypothetical protein